jgi:RimJ/RimL family protein N-acetyltransferase
MSLNNDPVSMETHLSWLKRRLTDPDSRLWIVETGDGPAGSIRLDREAESSWVSIALDSTRRGQGLGSAALELACRTAWDQGLTRCLLARAKAENRASLRLFERSGFKRTSVRDGIVTFELSQDGPKASSSADPEGSQA